MGKQKMKEGKVIDFDANEGREVRLLISQVRNLLEIKASEFAEQYVQANPEYPEYLMDDDFGGQIIQAGLDKLMQLEDWGEKEMLDFAALCFVSVFTDKLEFLYPDDEDDEDDEGDTIDEETE